RIAATTKDDEPAHALLVRRPVRNLRLVVVGSDRGLAGGYNSNLNRATERFLVDEKPKYQTIELATIARKAREHFRRRHGQMAKECGGGGWERGVERARELAADLTRDFLDEKIDSVLIVFNEFKSAISQTVTFWPLLPIRAQELPANEGRIDFEYEPSQKE